MFIFGLAAYLLVGGLVMLSLVTSIDFGKLGLLDTFAQRLIFIWAWPAMLFTMLLFPLCRDEGTDPGGTL